MSAKIGPHVVSGFGNAIHVRCSDHKDSYEASIFDASIAPQIKSDGRFRKKYVLDGGARLTKTFTMSGRVSGSTVRGSQRFRIKGIRSGHHYTCDSGSVGYTAKKQ